MEWCIHTHLDWSDNYFAERLKAPFDEQDRVDLIAAKRSNDEFRAHLMTHNGEK